MSEILWVSRRVAPVAWLNPFEYRTEKILVNRTGPGALALAKRALSLVLTVEPEFEVPVDAVRLFEATGTGASRGRGILDRAARFGLCEVHENEHGLAVVCLDRWPQGGCVEVPDRELVAVAEMAA